MRQVSIVIFMLLCLWPKATPADDDGFNVTVNVVARDAGKSSSGSGGFWVNQNEYGRVSMTFPDDPLNFIITSSGAKQGPVSHLLKDEGKFQFSRSTPKIMADIYLEPSLTAAGDIRLTGLLCKLDRASQSALYTYNEQKLDLVLADGGKKEMTLDSSSRDGSINIEISARQTGHTEYTPIKEENITFYEEYSLINMGTGKKEMNGRCTLGFGDDDSQSNGDCTQQLLIPLPEKDSLLYISSAEITDLKRNTDGSLTFNLEIIHIYALNPTEFPLRSEELKSEKTNITLFDKKITARIGEKTEVEVPGESESPLPFKSKEIFILTNTVSGN
jgi:hypothetical protein